jgi:hypothetical protein
MSRFIVRHESGVGLTIFLSFLKSKKSRENPAFHTQQQFDRLAPLLFPRLAFAILRGLFGEAAALSENSSARRANSSSCSAYWSIARR